MNLLHESRYYSPSKFRIGFGLSMLLVSCAVFACQPKATKDFKGPEAAKINANLLALDEKVRARGMSLAVVTADTGMLIVDNGLALEIVTSRFDARVERKLQMPGVTIRNTSAKYNHVSIVIEDLDLLYKLARIPEVRTISPVCVRLVGTVVSGSRGTATQRAVINFGDLPDEEAAATPRAPKEVHTPLPGPWVAPESESRQPPGTESDTAATAAALRAQGCHSRRNTGTNKNRVLEQQ